MTGGDDFFARWSNRKRAVAQEEATEKPGPESVNAPENVTDEPEATEESEEEILARFGLPAPESLGPGDDYTGFMQSGVPEFLRRRALRRLWRSNPVLANLDGLNDYDEDFTSPEETMKVLKTAYQVGRGFLRSEKESDEVVQTPLDGETGDEVARAENQVGDADPKDTSEVSVAPTDPDIGPETSETPESLGESEASEAVSRPAATSAPKPKRMRFKS